MFSFYETVQFYNMFDKYPKNEARISALKKKSGDHTFYFEKIPVLGGDIFKNDTYLGVTNRN